MHVASSFDSGAARLERSERTAGKHANPFELRHADARTSLMVTSMLKLELE